MLKKVLTHAKKAPAFKYQATYSPPIKTDIISFFHSNEFPNFVFAVSSFTKKNK